jgi:hypothetical protein
MERIERYHEIMASEADFAHNMNRVTVFRTHSHTFNCFAFELSGPKSTRHNFPVHNKAFRENLTKNANVSEQKKRFPLFSSWRGQRKSEALYHMVVSVNLFRGLHNLVRLVSVTCIFTLLSSLTEKPENINMHTQFEQIIIKIFMTSHAFDTVQENSGSCYPEYPQSCQPEQLCIQTQT